MRHHVRPEDLKSLVEKVGGDRIQIMHGKVDKVAPFSAAERLYQGFGGEESGVKLYVFEDVGHLIPLEKFRDIVASLEALMGST